MSSFNKILFSEKFNKTRAAFQNSSGILYVEDINDLSFWSLFFDDKEYEIKLFQNEQNQCVTGKLELQKYYSECHKYLLIAVDGDYDYLCENDKEAKIMCDSPFVIHTYSYSKESVIYHSDYIDSILENVRLYNNYSHFKSSDFLNEISKIIFPLLVIKLYEINTQNQKELRKEKISKLNKLLKDLLDVRGEKIDYVLSKDGCIINNYFDELSKKVSLHLNNISIDFNDEHVKSFKENLHEKGLREENAYRFIDGHTLEDNIVIPFMRGIHGRRKKYEEDNLPEYIDSQKVQRIGQIHNHFNRKCDIETLLSTHIEKIKEYKDPIFIKIRSKIEKLNEINI